MTDRDVMVRVARLFDRALVPVPRRKTHYKLPYSSQLRGTSAVRLMLGTHAWLGAGRKEQIDRALSCWAERRTRWSYRDLLCAAPACDSAAATRGLCRRHYDLWWKGVRRGRPTAFAPRERTGIAAVAPTVPHECDRSCELSWLAGLLEGEGTFTTTRSGTGVYPVLQVQMCAADVVARAGAILGAMTITRHDPTDPRWSPVFRAAVSGHAAADWMRTLRPMMGIRRSAAIDAALAAYHPIRLVDPPTTCVVPGCEEPHRARGLCHKHYMSWSRDVAKGREPRVRSLRD